MTLLYGLSSGVSSEKVKDAIKSITFYDVKIHNLSIFENEEFDVLKFDVKGECLDKANKSIAKLPNKQSFPDYHAHLTVAYLKVGEGKKYVEMFKGYKYEAKPMFVVYSPGGDRDKIVIGIKKK